MDKSSKIIFALVAAGLWMNVASEFFRPASAQADILAAQVQSIAQSVKLLANGECKNSKLC